MSVAAGCRSTDEAAAKLRRQCSKRVRARNVSWLRIRVDLSTAVAAGCTVVACGDHAVNRDGYSVTDSAGVRILSVSPPGEGHAHVLAASREWGGDEPIQQIVDARTLPNGETGVLDGPSGVLWLVDLRTGNATTVGGATTAHPASTASAGFTGTAQGLVIWDPGRRRFSLFNYDRGFLEFIEQPFPGDASSFRWREDRALQDLRRRVESDGERIWLQLEDSEHDLRDPGVRGLQEVERSGYLLALSSTGAAPDTVLTYAAPSRFVDAGGPSHPPALFLPAPVWAVHDSLYAYARSDTAEVRVYGSRGVLHAVLRWQPQQQLIDIQARRMHATMYVHDNQDDFPPDVLAPKNRDAFNGFADRISTAEVAPLLSGIEIHGSCIWVAPFDLADNSTGLSRTWTYYELTGRGFGTVTFDTVPTKITHIDADHALGRVIDASTGVHTIRLYDLSADIVRTCQQT